MSYKTITNKHPLRWFEHRVGQYLIKNMTADLFNEPIKVIDKQHAKALYITQDKGHKYTERSV